MKSFTTRRFWKAYERLDEATKRQAREAYKLFEKDPAHPGLYFKKKHTSANVYSVRINLDFRALGIRDGEEIVWFWIGPHDEYDQLIAQL